LVPIFGATQDSQYAKFLSKLVGTCESESLPMLVGENYNIIGNIIGKNNDNFSACGWAFCFSLIMESLYLRKIVLTGREFTWANHKETPTYEKLDIIHVNVKRE
jgi:hypothetical protein